MTTRHHGAGRDLSAHARSLAAVPAAEVRSSVRRAAVLSVWLSRTVSAVCPLEILHDSSPSRPGSGGWHPASAFAAAVTTTYTAAELTAADVIMPDLTAVAVRESASGLRVTLSGR